MSKPGQGVATTVGQADQPPVDQLLTDIRSVIHVAEYLTVLPPPDVLHRELHEAIETARARTEANEGGAGLEGTA